MRMLSAAMRGAVAWLDGAAARRRPLAICSPRTRARAPPCSVMLMDPLGPAAAPLARRAASDAARCSRSSRSSPPPSPPSSSSQGGPPSASPRASPSAPPTTSHSSSNSTSLSNGSIAAGAQARRRAAGRDRAGADVRAAPLRNVRRGAARCAGRAEHAAAVGKPLYRVPPLPQSCGYALSPPAGC